MTREEAIVVLKAFMDNPLFSDVHRATFSIAIHDIKQRHEWDINKLMLVPKTEWEQEPTTKNDLVVDKPTIIDWNNCHTSEQLDSIATTKNDLGVDCVARQDIERYIEGFINEYTPKKELEFINLELDGLKHLPSVTPQEPKTGHWIANAPQYDMLNPQYICSECGNAHTRITPYCEMCGAKMVEPQESEDKE